MTDMNLQLRAVLWALVAIGTICVCAVGVVVQPIVVHLVRSGRPTTRAQLFGYFLGPLLATVLALIALAGVPVGSAVMGARLDSLAPLIPIAAIGVWVGVTSTLLRRSGA